MGEDTNRYVSIFCRAREGRPMFDAVDHHHQPTDQGPRLWHLDIQQEQRLERLGEAQRERWQFHRPPSVREAWRTPSQRLGCSEHL